jgi:hypothetical protein
MTSRIRGMIGVAPAVQGTVHVEGGDVHDERLWVPIAAAADASGNTTALVGTPEQVAARGASP